MYGLLIENIIQYIQDNFGVDKWNEIRRLAQIEETSFHTHTVYPDVYTKNIIDKACKTLRISEKQLLLGIGESFVTFIGRYGYDVVLSALGREFSDFLNSLDDLHEYLRLSYPRLKPPSYFCDNENEYGLILHYRTKRNFLLWYTVGQILKVAKLFYSTDVEVELLSENQEINEYHFILQLHFDNRVYLERLRNGIGEYQHSRCLSRLSVNSPLLFNNNNNNNSNNSNNNQNKNDLSIINNRESPIGINYQCPSQYHHSNSHHHNQMMICRAVSPSSSQSLSSLVASPSPTQFYSLNNSLEHMNLSPITLEAFMDIFPFSIVFDSNMKICQIGSCLKMVCSNILGQNLTKIFSLIKPKIDFNWESILRHTNTTFELKLDILLKSGNNSSRIIRELRNISRSNLADYEMMNRSDVEIAREVRYQEEYGNLPHHVTVINDSSPIGDNPSFLKLKGQMIYFDCWKCISFLGAPNVANLDTLIKTGLYLNDLSMHDFSRDMVLAGQQQSAELKLALDQELRKSRQLEITIRKLDEERRRSDELLYQMISCSHLLD
ncbi:soluble guanylate cyclase 88e-like [Dermatophagoides farinae]|uniref:guanylate cyclase n=1 Tax=Dermatophagoides farinae TaxID=6954 RepID=A0A9D4P8I0_DERFA|nr:soluble guanylate cyclase 88e-like [Dermatophagoides farinae]